jgi:hypothetical protein
MSELPLPTSLSLAVLAMVAAAPGAERCETSSATTLSVVREAAMEYCLSQRPEDIEPLVVCAAPMEIELVSDVMESTINHQRAGLQSLACFPRPLTFDPQPFLSVHHPLTINQQPSSHGTTRTILQGQCTRKDRAGWRETKQSC